MPSKQRLKTDSLESDLELIRASGVVWPDSAKVTPMMRQWLQEKTITFIHLTVSYG